MKTRKYKYALYCFLLFAGAGVLRELNAQGISFFRPTQNNAAEEKKVPTVITSESLEVDIENNKATFFGKVKVDDHEMTIECDKMVIYLEPAEEEGGEKVETADLEQNVARQVSRIVCEGNVVITREPPASDENPEPIQKSRSGRADYDVKTGMIVLTREPVINRGNDILKGEVITIWRDSEKVRVKGPEVILHEDEY